MLAALREEQVEWSEAGALHTAKAWQREIRAGLHPRLPHAKTIRSRDELVERQSGK